MIHFYGLTQTAVMDMPIRRFWLFAGNVDRIMAQKDLRALIIGASVQTSESGKAHQNRLVLELGTIQKVDDAMAQLYEERDEAGFRELMMMAQ